MYSTCSIIIDTSANEKFLYVCNSIKYHVKLHVMYMYVPEGITYMYTCILDTCNMYYAGKSICVEI